MKVFNITIKISILYLFNQHFMFHSSWYIGKEYIVFFLRSVKECLGCLKVWVGNKLYITTNHMISGKFDCYIVHSELNIIMQYLSCTLRRKDISRYRCILIQAIYN